ncbi:MAG: UDP-N-acetylmuramoyl-L-alanine--D-glutamate ligase [Anaerolineae bacterium]
MTHADFAGKRIVILGLARQGTALARFFLQQGAQVTISDAAPADQLSEPLTELAGQPVRLVLGGHPPELLHNCDLLCLSGGVPPQIPLVGEARRQGIPLSNDALLTVQRSFAQTLGITGSSGKTTTTTLVGLMLAAENRLANEQRTVDAPAISSSIIPNSSASVHRSSFTTWVGGNIGIPLIDKLAQMQPNDKIVLELSSFQLELFNAAAGGASVSPQIAAILNITPNHLDRHPSMSHYAAAKANILRWQGADDIAILGADDPVTGGWLRSGRVAIAAGNGQAAFSFPLAGRVLGFGLHAATGDGCWLSDDQSTLLLRLNGVEQPVLTVNDLKVRGRHNLLNVAAACALAAAAGASPQAMAAAVRTFHGVAHRLELVREWHNVRWYNDSIATAPERAAAALRSFDEPIVLLAGGRDKKLPWNELVQLAQNKVRVIVAFGEAADLIARAVVEQSGAAVPVVRAADLPAAVDAAAQAAQPGDVVLLSPGGTSFDAYKDFAARGEHFRALVQGL